MSSLYPPDILDPIKSSWATYHGPRQVRMVLFWEETPDGKRKKVTPEQPQVRVEPGRVGELPFPDDSALRSLLDTVYHASFLTEEARRIAIRVAYLPPNVPDNIKRNGIQLTESPFRLVPPRPFTPSELLRLAPATDPVQSLIVVANSQDVSPTITTPLTIWGILHLGRDWWELVTGRSSGAICPPNILTLSSFAPGQITISSGGHVLLRFRDGGLVTPPLTSIRQGPIGQFFADAAEDLYSRACQELGRSRYHKQDDSNDHPRSRYYNTFSNIFLRCREGMHGGSFIIVPDELTPDDPRLLDRVHIKYGIDPPPIWDTLLRETTANSKFYELYFPENDSAALPQEDEGDPRTLVYYANARLEGANQKIAEFESFAASLASVDGAVVLTKRLRILGFGGEIGATSPALEMVRVASSSEGDAGQERPITSFGTRHRSAFRFCSSFENAVCVVISQDGQVRAIKRVGRNLVMWDDLNLGHAVL